MADSRRGASRRHRRSVGGSTTAAAPGALSGGAPAISIVIAARNAAAVIAECLSALCSQDGVGGTEIILADGSVDGTAEVVRRRFPAVRVLHFADRCTIPELRGAGIAAARGPIVALIDPYCIVGKRWLPELLALHTRRPEPAIGGAVELRPAGAGGTAQWAAFFSEYAAFMPPVREGPAPELAGGNIAYKRRALGDPSELAREGFWKPFVNARLRTEGQGLWIAASLPVGLRKPVPFREFFRSRYHHGRCFGAMRAVRATRLETCWRALTVPALPFVALWRGARAVWPKRRRRVEFLMSMPLLLLLHGSWAWGEFCGYLRGPGRSRGQLFY